MNLFIFKIEYTLFLHIIQTDIDIFKFIMNL